MINLSPKSVVASGDPALGITSAFLDEHATALLNAAALLGGPTAQRRCLRLLSKIAESSSLSMSLRLELIWLHQLIAVQNVGDPDTEETAHFGMLDVMDPRVEEICLETDRLFDLLVAISRLHPICDVIPQNIFDLSAA